METGEWSNCPPAPGEVLDWPRNWLELVLEDVFLVDGVPDAHLAGLVGRGDVEPGKMHSQHTTPRLHCTALHCTAHCTLHTAHYSPTVPAGAVLGHVDLAAVLRVDVRVLGRVHTPHHHAVAVAVQDVLPLGVNPQDDRLATL